MIPAPAHLPPGLPPGALEALQPDEQDVFRLEFGSALAEGDPVGLATVRARRAVGLLHAVHTIEKAYDPSQPRAQDGKWTSGGVGDLGVPPELMRPHKDKLLHAAKQYAKDLGFDPDMVTEGEPGKTFQLGDKTYKYAGAAYMDDGHIEVFTDEVTEASLPGLMAHEVMHQRYNAFERLRSEESARLSKDPRNTNDLMSPDGTLRPDVQHEYPVYTAYHNATGGAKWETMKERDGVTDYSKTYWAEWQKGRMGTDKAVHETLAEMARLNAETGVRPGGPEWNAFYRAVVKHGKLKK